MKTALITGAGRNIGRAIALRLGAAGHRVIVNGSSDETACNQVVKEVQAAGGEALTAMGDMGERADVERITRSALQQFGRIDIVVSNAAIRPSSAFHDLQTEDWERVMAVNFYATVWLCEACIPGMREAGWGRIITFSGRNAIAGTLGRPHVAASKHATWGLTRSLANEYGREGITTNMISPGVIVGEVADPKFQQGLYEKFSAENPVGHLGRPDNIAGTVGLLVSDDGDFINGQMLQVNGGVV